MQTAAGAWALITGSVRAPGPMDRRRGRTRTLLPTCYYEGYLEKRSFKDKTSRKMWACLCGNTLFFFNEKRDSEYIEKLDLSDLISITDDNSQDRNLEAARLHVQTKEGVIRFTVPNAEARELWKGFIHSVIQLSVPSSLNLLPGQIHMLKEAVDLEKERIKSGPPPPPPPPAAAPPPPAAPPAAAASSCSPYISLQADMPACFRAVSRLEAELLLEREAKRGNLLLRPGSNGNSFAVTTRQDHDGSVFRHYRVTRNHSGGFIIDVDNPVHCSTLYDVITYLVGNTDGVLVPLILEEHYEKKISFIQSDKENGEKCVQQASAHPAPPSVPPKPVCLKIPSPDPEPAPGGKEEEEEEEEELYMNPLMEAEEQAEGSSKVPQAEKKTQKKAMMPPTPLPRKSLSSLSQPSSSSSTNRDQRSRSNTEPHIQIPPATLTELKLKLEQKAKCLE